jgi:hypothetical protein
MLLFGYCNLRFGSFPFGSCYLVLGSFSLVLVICILVLLIIPRILVQYGFIIPFNFLERYWP